MSSVRPLNQPKDAKQTTESVVTKGLIRRATPCVVALLVSLDAELAAQEKPDFSGSWVLESGAQSAGDIPKALLVNQSIVRTNARGEPMKPFFRDITVTRYFVAGTRTDTYIIGTQGGVVTVLPPDGRPNRLNPQTRVAVRWDADRLIIDTGSYSGSRREDGPYTERTEVWELDSAGELRVTVNDRGSATASTSTTAMYRKE
jgi:hypothetical protein